MKNTQTSFLAVEVEIASEV